MRCFLTLGLVTGAFSFYSCQMTTGKNHTASLTKASDTTQQLEENEQLPTEASLKEGYQSFAFYEGIKEDGKRSLTRNDGTTHGMPCISKAVIQKGEEIKYDFWHGHNRELHRFTLTAENLEQLRSGKSIEVFTAVVDRHKHAVKVDLEKPCTVKTVE